MKNHTPDRYSEKYFLCFFYYTAFPNACLSFFEKAGWKNPSGFGMFS